VGWMVPSELSGSGLIVHHWDTDGICSARLLLERLTGEVDNFTPEIGNYYLTEEELSRAARYDYVVVADMALPEEDILRLSREAEVIIFDHHIQREIGAVNHHNPVGGGADPEDYPSTSWVVNECFGNGVNLYALLGIVGDLEHRIKENKRFWPVITTFCGENGLTFGDLLRMTMLLDSNYRLGDKRAVEEAPRALLGHDGPSYILGNGGWSENLVLLEEEVRRLMDEPAETVRGTLMKRMDTGFNIISTVTRRLAWETGKDIVVVNTGFYADRAQIYVRSGSVDLGPLIQRGRELGLRVGGKREVLGAIVPEDRVEAFEEILEFLELDG